MADWRDYIPTLDEAIAAFTQPVDDKGNTVVGNAVRANVIDPMTKNFLPQMQRVMPSAFAAGEANNKELDKATAQGVSPMTRAGIGLRGLASQALAGVGDVAGAGVSALASPLAPVKDLGAALVGMPVMPLNSLPKIDPTALETTERGSQSMLAAPAKAAAVNADAFDTMVKLFSGMTRRDTEALLKSIGPPEAKKTPSAKDVGGFKYLASVENEKNRIWNDPKATEQQKMAAEAKYRLALEKYIASGGMLPGAVVENMTGG